MQKAVVMARAHRGRPVTMVVIGSEEGVVFLSHPELVSRVMSGEVPSLGFPVQDVFGFEADLFDRLESAWHSSGTAPAAWEEAKPMQG